mgnify:CR=1 FL=1
MNVLCLIPPVIVPASNPFVSVTYDRGNRHISKLKGYQNEKDTKFPPHSAYNDFLQFKKFITENNLNHIVEFNPFIYDVIPENMTQHSFQFPINNNYQEVLINFIKI